MIWTENWDCSGSEGASTAVWSVQCEDWTQTWNMDAVVNLFGMLSSYWTDQYDVGVPRLRLRTCGLLWVFWLAAGRWKQSRPWHWDNPNSISSCLGMSSLAGSASPTTAQPQSRVWPTKCQMPWLRRSYCHLQLPTMHSRFPKYHSVRSANCVSEGWSWQLIRQPLHHPP